LRLTIYAREAHNDHRHLRILVAEHNSGLLAGSQDLAEPEGEGTDMMSQSAQVKQVWKSPDGEGHITIKQLCDSGLRVTAIYQGKRVQDACCWPRTSRSCRITDMLSHNCLMPITGTLDRVIAQLIKRATCLIETKIADSANAVEQEAAFEEERKRIWEKLS